ncbi:MAG: hypothetical protein US52_C0006G0001 [candidate division WS6 bacterium GW2011_GWA2_37_6]|uniref:Uncharacterized protein n=1 Tax=candidate division WS6 bacterium GW2011_GWA2_37_6 TaxID=1619087 RepID=A0A0G0K6C0_9BACT|nr:MAG: hypothetical protein US52_C0006G0001 [candidate division WS6 bacterium GW2011_GWA2_37_6]
MSKDVSYASQGLNKEGIDYQGFIFFGEQL